jgi:hypothetical protein
MTKRIISILLAIILFLVGGIGGYIIRDKKTSESSSYDVLYKNIDKLSVEEKLNVFHSKLKAEISPSEIKYLLDKIIPSVNNDTQNDLLAKYLNHIQYYMSTYSDFVSIYQAIMNNMSSTVDFEDPASTDLISDKVLKTIVAEIYESDLMIIMPEAYSDKIPYILVDYDKIREEYGTIINDATNDYIEFKEIAQNGELSDVNGMYDPDKISAYIVRANDFINKYPQYPLVSDIIFSYILGSKMYIGTYNVSEPFKPEEEMVNRYRTFVEENPNTPITNALKEIIEIYEKGEEVSMEKINEWNTLLDGLLGTQQ